MSQTPQGKNFKTAQTPGTGKSSKGSRNEGSQPESAKNSRSGKVNSFAQVVKMYVPKTPKGSETPAGLNTKPEASFTGAQEDFTSPAVIKAANNFVALRKPNKKKGSARMVLQKVYHSKSIDLNKEEAKKDDEDKQKEEDDGEIRERATVGDRYRGEEEEDETMLQYRHSLPAHLTCPTEIEGRGTVESPTGNYEFKDEAVDENEVIRLVGTDNQKETAQKEERTSHIEQPKEQIGGAENIICSPLDVPDNKLGDEVQDQVQEEGGQTQQEKDVKKEEADVDVLEEEQVGQGDIGKQETEPLRTEEEQLEGEHLNTISEEREGHEEEEILQQAREQKEIPETGAIQEYHSQQEHNLSKDQSLSSSIQDNTAFSEDRSARDRRVSETTSKAETASTPANETYISQRNDDAQETFKERTGSSGFEIQAGSRAQGEVVKKSARPPTEFREREIQEVEVRRQVEEAPKQKRNIPPRHEETEKPEIKTETPGDRKGSGHPVDSREHKTPAGVSDIDVKKEMQRQSEQKKFQEDLTSKLEKVQTIDELAIDEKTRKGREGCCQAGCSMF